jgi:hypothetical protein
MPTKMTRNLLKSHLIEINPQEYADQPDKINFLGEYAKPGSKVKLLRSTDKIKIATLLTALKSPL